MLIHIESWATFFWFGLNDLMTDAGKQNESERKIC
jgi:hypothetical protein